MQKITTTILLGVFVVCAGCAAHNNQAHTATAVFSTQKEAKNPQTLIVFYEIGEKQSVLDAIQHTKSKIVYEYNMLNGFAIATDYPNTTTAYLAQIPSVLSVEVSQIYELH